jgi:hypothetical protein
MILKTFFMPSKKEVSLTLRQNVMKTYWEVEVVIFTG